MKIISWNVNGLRAVYKKNFLKWFKQANADIVCLQEIKARKEQLPVELIRPKGYYSYFNTASKKGYSGMVVYTKTEPLTVDHKLGMRRFDQEGRMLSLQYPDFTLINLYLPHGGRKKENLTYKLNVYRRLFSYLKKIRNKNIILAGDFNIAHQEIDLARPKNNKNNTMFTPEEREQINKIVELSFTDTFRKFHKGNGHYTWWPYYANARARNLGWRLDYIFTSKKLAAKLKKTFILSKVKGSDHCPIGIDI